VEIITSALQELPWFYSIDWTIQSLILGVVQFGMGPRICQGKNIALMILNKVIPQLVRRFDFELDGPLKDKEWKTLNYWVIKQKDFKCRLKLREVGKH
jgi:cytochrome P450